MPRKKVPARKKSAPRIKTQERFEELVKEELHPASGTPVVSTLKKKRNKDTSLLDNTPTKSRKNKLPPTPPRPEHQTRISELNEITFDEKKFATPKLADIFKKGSNGTYISSILYRNMIDFLKREQFYLDNVAGPEKTKIKDAIQKDLNTIKTMIRAM
tara:strand:- start:616 stop:1089 length:474 start_codon:yes stop_codon:yes gene_type:complete